MEAFALRAPIGGNPTQNRRVLCSKNSAGTVPALFLWSGSMRFCSPDTSAALGGFRTQVVVQNTFVRLRMLLGVTSRKFVRLQKFQTFLPN